MVKPVSAREAGVVDGEEGMSVFDSSLCWMGFLT